MANVTIDAIRAAEKKAAAELKAANAAAEEALIAAKDKANEILTSSKESCSNVVEQQRKEALEKADALIETTVSKSGEELEKLKSEAKGKENEAILAILEELTA